MPMNVKNLIKVTLILIVAFFIVKQTSGWMKNKFPNRVTTAVNNVVQGA